MHKKASTSRSVNINHPCCKSSCDGKTRAKDRNFGHSSRFKSTRYEPYRQEQHHNESEERRPYNERRRSSSSLLPPRDALLHVPRVTPPAPINQGEQQTPEAAQSYTHPPDIEAYVLPRLEMRFETFEETKNFYNVYAKHAGFAVREGPKFKTRAYLYCTCHGVYESKVSETNRQRNKTTARTDYRAKMRLKIEKDGTLVVKGIVWEHNHRLQLTPQMLVFLHSHKFFDKTILEYVKYLQFKGIEHAQIMSILGGDDPGSYFLEMNAKDLINMKAKNSRIDDVDDVLKTVNFFREMKAINREFFCDMQLDESDRVKNIFWANASCRGAYQDFGDCVTFDTTYKTNKYHMPLGVFVGTNNHLQTTFFGFALIRDEDAESFRWLFKTFLRCMRGKAPTCILTVPGNGFGDRRCFQEHNT